MSEEKVDPWMNSYSMPVVPAGEKFVMLSGLSERYKREAWAVISRTNPALANLLRDPTLKSVMAHFDADLFVDAASVPTLPPEPLKGRKRPQV